MGAGNLFWQEHWSASKVEGEFSSCSLCALVTYHLLQLACIQAANKTNGIKHVYTTLDHTMEILLLLTKKI